MTDPRPLPRESRDNPWFSLSCQQAGCDEPATHVVVQSSDMALLFRSNAGTLCEKCALGMEDHGGLALSIPGYVEAVKRERPELVGP